MKSALSNVVSLIQYPPYLLGLSRPTLSQFWSCTKFADLLISKISNCEKSWSGPEPQNQESSLILLSAGRSGDEVWSFKDVKRVGRVIYSTLFFCIYSYQDLDLQPAKLSKSPSQLLILILSFSPFLTCAIGFSFSFSIA